MYSAIEILHMHAKWSSDQIPCSTGSGVREFAIFCVFLCNHYETTVGSGVRFALVYCLVIELWCAIKSVKVIDWITTQPVLLSPDESSHFAFQKPHNFHLVQF